VVRRHLIITMTRRRIPIRQRRRLLQGLGGSVFAAALPASRTAAAAQSGPAAHTTDITSRLAAHIAEARDRAVPPEVARHATDRILDTIGAIVSGARLKPGELAVRFVRQQGGTPEATVCASGLRSSAINAALANGMFAHADETDDFEPITKAHPGCAVVPAAFAVAERDGRSGTELLRAVVVGYDACCRFLLALGNEAVRGSHRSAEGMSSTMGAAVAAASVARLSDLQTRYALSYAAQQVSGLWSWERDAEHVEKAFDFSGMGARNGVTAALMAQAGFTGVAEVFDGEHNVLEALSSKPRPEEMVAGLGSRFFVSETAIKVFSVGYPIQAPLHSFLELKRQHGFTADTVDRIVVRLPTDGARIVDNRAMPDVNCQYVIAVTLVDGQLTFESSHSYERMKDPRVLAVQKRVQLVADSALMDPAAPRSGRVEVTLRDGRTVSHFTRHAPGTRESPLDARAVDEKARSLIAPVLGASRAGAIITRVRSLESLANVRELMKLLS
jgi:2-methylcitrate dehydratase PrpD